MKLKKLNFPDSTFAFRTLGQSKQIFDSIRRKYVALTPEEWVRQHTARFLVEELKYPASLIGVEKGFFVNTLRKRADLVVYSATGLPWMIVECKSSNVAVTEDTLYQAARYHLALKVKYLALTNGLNHFCCRIDRGGVVFLNEWPRHHPPDNISHEVR